MTRRLFLIVSFLVVLNFPAGADYIRRNFSLNGIAGYTQTFAAGTAGTDFAISSSGTTHTFNLPDASATARGAVTTGTQTIAGLKTFSTGIISAAPFAGNSESVVAATGVVARSTTAGRQAGVFADDTIGPYIQSNTNSAGNSTQGDAAMQIVMGNTPAIYLSGATGAGSPRTWTVACSFENGTINCGTRVKTSLVGPVDSNLTIGPTSVGVAGLTTTVLGSENAGSDSGGVTVRGGNSSGAGAGGPVTIRGGTSGGTGGTVTLESSGGTDRILVNDTGLNFPALSASQLVATDASKYSVSVNYTSANTASAVVQRDGSGNFAAGTITAGLTGNATTATALAANPADCGANQYATTIAASGDLTCAQPSVSQVTGAAALSGSVFTGDVTGDGGDQLFGFLNNSVTSTTTTLTAGQCGSTIVSDSTDVVTLPEASTVIGCRYTFVCGTADDFDVNPNDATDQILPFGGLLLSVTPAAGDAIRCTDTGASIVMEAVGINAWAIIGDENGTWSDVN